MDFDYSGKVKALQARLTAFMDEVVYPNEATFTAQLDGAPSRWQIPPIMEEMKRRARDAGLWNLFLPDSEYGAGLTNLEYAPLAEIMGRSLDRLRGVQLLGARHRQHGGAGALRHAGAAGRWLAAAAERRDPLLLRHDRAGCRLVRRHQYRSRASSGEATTTCINGRKWWSSGAGDPRCKIAIVMGKTDPGALAPRAAIDDPGADGHAGPAGDPRTLPVFGYDDAPHGHAEILFEDVRVPAANILWAEGKGFAIAQGRLGPGRIHHCMRTIGLAERALEMMVDAGEGARRLRQAPGRAGRDPEWIADARIEIDQARLLTLQARRT